VFLALDFERAIDIPKTLPHTVRFTAEDNSAHAFVIELNVRQRAPIVVAPPLHGPGWLAINAHAPNSDHCRALMVEGGQPWLAQRHAIDFAKFQMVDGKRLRGKVRRTSYFCYDDPIVSAAPGKVIEVMDGLPENVPHSGNFAIELTWTNAGDNHVVVDIGYGLYAFYAHMRPGSIVVKEGVITTGQVLGHVGNTGSSTEAHLHLRIIDRPQFLSGQGCRTSSQISAPARRSTFQRRLIRM
jgi:Peptidase family M23